MKKIILLMILLSCSSNANINKVQKTDRNQIEITYKDFHQKGNKNGRYTLYYKVEENQMSPVKWFTYFVVDNSNNKIIREPKGVAAEDIYWKNENTLAIVPYKEVEQLQTIVGENKNNNEILINIK